VSLKTNQSDNYVSCSVRSPTISGEYRIKNNSPVNEGEGVIYFDVEKGWAIPKMVTEFYRVNGWYEFKTTSKES
jgi:hypothetical protein